MLLQADDNGGHQRCTNTSPHQFDRSLT